MSAPAPEHDDTEPATRPSLVERWRATEPIRLALWPVALAVVGLFIGYGLLAPERAPLWLTLVAALLGGGLPIAGAAIARRDAWAPATVRRVADAHADQAYEQGWADALEHERLVVEDAPGSHAARTTEQPAVHPATEAIRAQRREVPPVTT